MADIALEQRHQKFIERQLEEGRFDNASDVVQAGLEMLEDIEDDRESWLRDEVPARLAEMQVDPSIGIPADEVFDKLEALYRVQKSR